MIAMLEFETFSFRSSKLSSINITAFYRPNSANVY